jgi:uncharacterized cupin superfamily protein
MWKSFLRVRGSAGVFPVGELVVVRAKEAITTKDTKVHEGKKCLLAIGSCSVGSRRLEERTRTAMKDFPAFMKEPANRIAVSSQATPGVEGYVFDGADGSQMAFWTCSETATSTPHVHEFDEYMIVVAGCYTLILHTPNGEQRIPVRAGVSWFSLKWRSDVLR